MKAAVSSHSWAYALLTKQSEGFVTVLSFSAAETQPSYPRAPCNYTPTPFARPQEQPWPRYLI